jgi:hypothetical protein
MLRAQRRDRRGVLLMVVLSMLALFLLLGTAFLVSSRFYATTGKEAGKMNRTTNNPADLMERAMLQVLRDTNNPSSSIRYHSLLRDVYGSDGFVGQVLTFNSRTDLMPRYAGGTTANLLGPTQGQFVDLFVFDPTWPGGRLPDDRDVVDLERAPDGTTVDHTMSRANNYYAGCLLTMLNGPAAGQTTRIVDSRVVEYIADPNGNMSPVTRLRVMVFPRADGSSLRIGGPDGIQLEDLMLDVNNNQGYAFMVNGRANSGTGAGLNRLAQRGGAKLNAVEMSVGSGGLYGTEMALTPNLRFVDLTQAAAFIGGNDPFGITGATLANFTALNPNRATVLYPTAEGPGGSNESYDAVDYQNMFLAHMPVSPRATAGLIDSTGATLDVGVDEQTLNEFLSRASMRLDMENTIVPSFHQPALINYWYQRLHDAPWLVSAISDENQRARVILAPYEARAPGDPIADQVTAIKRKITLRPIPEDHPNFDGGNPASRYVGTVSPYGTRSQLRLSTNSDIRFPAWEVVGPWDVDNDNDGINDSVWVDLGDPVQETENGTLYKPLYAFLIVDLDNRLNVNAHGSPDHFAQAPLDPVLYATGNVGNLAGGEQRALGNSAIEWSSNLMPHGMGWGPGEVNLRSILSPLTQPYAYAITRGTNAQDDYARLFFGRLAADPGSDANWGRMGSYGTSPTFGPGRNFNGANLASVNASREPNLAFEFVGFPAIDRVRAENVYAQTGDVNLIPYLAPSAFGTTPDLRGRYALGVDYMGQPVYESSYDGFIQAPSTPYIGQPLVTIVDESPYETYLSKDGRRGVPDEQTTRAALASFGTTGIAVNDDALFATSELERLLRRYDPETGTAPSRLFDIVDAFDPVKYVSTINVGSPEQNLAYAQTVTGINSRQVTTDSYEIPTPSDVVPSYITELGPDGAPGIAGNPNGFDGDDDANGVPDDASEIGWHEEQDPSDPSAGLYLAAWSDDFEAYTGKSVTEARFVDVVWYRIQRAREKRGLPIYNWHNPQAVAIMNNICDQLLPPEVLAGYKMDINRPFGDGRDNGDGIDNDGNGLIDEPGEVGDVYLNGIVDEPAEAGEPYLDANGNGVWDTGEKFLDLNGNQAYDPPLDNLWAAQLNGVGAMLNATMGVDVTGRGSYIDANNNGVRDPVETTIQPGQPTLRDDGHLARQLYARHLYMLMMVLMDEDYLAPYDPADPSVRGFLRIESILLANGGMSTFDAKVEAQRRYTCRQIAQWAINCVDFRDSDSINTPFEYDENPWDGWGTVNEATGEHFPLDGDPATDENHGQRIDWANMGTTGERVMTNALPTIGGNGNQLPDINATRGLVWGAERPELLISEVAAFHDLRQEDLVTSEDEGDNTMAPSQDPNQPEDDDLDQRLAPRGSLYVEVYNPNSGDAPKPVELYRHGNWDRDGNNEINDADRYHWLDMNGNGQPDLDNNGHFIPGVDMVVEGVLLDRLSDRVQLGPDNNKARRSPVWRIIVVEEHPGYHASEGVINEAIDPQPVTRDAATSHEGDLQGGDALLPSPNKDYADAVNGIPRITERPWLAPMNMDWDDMYFIPPWVGNTFAAGTSPWKMSTWQQRATDIERTDALNPKNEPGQFDRVLFAKPYPYIEREFYFTTGNTPFYAHSRSLASGDPDTNVRSTERSYTDIERGTPLQQYFTRLNVRIPFNYIDLGDHTFPSSNRPLSMVSMPFRFVSNQLNGSRADVAIAPIMPGRYGVIGSAGAVYQSQGLDRTTDTPVRTRFITTLGRNVSQGGTTPKYSTLDEDHIQQIVGTRRIELQPSPSPFVQQVVVGANGGMPVGGDASRANEMIMAPGAPNAPQSGAVNMTATVVNSNLQSASEVLAPVVAIPVDNMSVSEPAYGYGVRARELYELEVNSGDEGQTWKPDGANGEGAFVNDAGEDAHFDTPFDVDPEFQDAERNPKHLPKYRVVHLQRLADPTMPWNPPPGYNTADKDDTDKLIFAYHDARLPVNPYLTVDSAAVDLTVFNGTSSSQAPETLPAFNNFYARERGSQLLRTVGSAIAFPQRWIWNQDSFLALRRAGIGNETRRQTKREDLMPQQILADHLIRPNHFDYYFGHSLGLPNEALGAVYLRPDTQLANNVIDPTDITRDDGDPRTMGPALGAPRPDQNLGVESTAPWMNWNNRPFVSESEILQVPGWSSMELLRKFSGMNTANNQQNADVAKGMNPYNGAYPGGVPAEVNNAERYKRMSAGFSHLMNFQQTSPEPARIEQDPSGNPICVGAPNFHRILDYVHTPSRFVATDTLLNPVAFSAATVTSPDDPRSGMAAPFNRVPDYREPGKVNLNTVVSQRGTVPVTPTSSTGIAVWSDVFDGLMHRVRDMDPVNFSQPGYGHFGPAWRDVVLSRRGYADPVLANSLNSVDRVDLVLSNDKPSFFSNPFRSSQAGDLVPLESLKDDGVNASMLRAHPFRPGSNYQWGANGPNTDHNNNGLRSDTREAGYGDDSPLTDNNSATVAVPLFSELTSTPGIDAPRNSAMHYMPLTRIDNLTTTRSGVFAVWVTVGYFEVLPAPNWDADENNVQQKFRNQTGDTADPPLRARALYDKVYPQGYQLGKELKSETGDVDRHRSFYIIDRTRPVAFKPGEDVNVEDAILLRRRID